VAEHEHAAGADGDAEVALEDLPVAVRTRVVAVVASVLPEVTGLPPALRRVGGFAPARRARLGGTAVAAAPGDPRP